MLCPVSAVFPTLARPASALQTIERLISCDPRPAEIIVYVDGGDTKVSNLIKTQYPEVRVLEGSGLLGPGGARNELMNAARYNLVANFDDDSYPANPHFFFSRVMQVAENFPSAAAISAASHEAECRHSGFWSIASHSGCGAIIRKEWFLKTTGYVPLPIAYNMEEIDLGLQFHALGGLIVFDPKLQVIHDRLPHTRPEPIVNATILANTLLFPFLRYPIWLCPLGILRLISRLNFLFRMGWTQGIAQGLQLTPRYLFRHRKYRKPVGTLALLSWLRLTRDKIKLSDPLSVHASHEESE